MLEHGGTKKELAELEKRVNMMNSGAKNMDEIMIGTRKVKKALGALEVRTIKALYL